METPLKQTSPIQLPQDFKAFKLLPDFDSIEYQGVSPSGFHRYKLNLGTESRLLFCGWMVLKEDALAWKSFQELIKQTLEMTAAQIRGFFGFELLSLDLKEGLANFHPGNLSQLLVNYAKNLEPGNQILIRYTSLWMVLSKRVPADWGKIEFKTRTQVVSKPSDLASILKNFLQDAETAPNQSAPPLFALFDLGEIPVFKFGDEEQTKKIIRWLEGLKKSNTPIPEIYICHQGKLTDLGAQFGFREI